MFLQSFSEEESRAFLALAREFVRADDRISENEIRILNQFCLEMYLDPKLELPLKSRAEWLDTFKPSRVHQYAVILELLGLAHADDDFGDAEAAILKEVGQHFQISEADMQKMADWVDRYVKLMGEIGQLMGALPKA
jgi:uncharacterized tellurite resistance protein B-like protein